MNVELEKSPTCPKSSINPRWSLKAWFRYTLKFLEPSNTCPLQSHMDMLSGLLGVHAFSIQNHFRPLYEDYPEPLSKVALKCGSQSRLARGDNEGVILCMAQGLSSMLGSLMDLSTQAIEALGCCTGPDTE